VEFGGDASRVARLGAAVALTDPRPVVRADARHSGDLGLHDIPVGGAVSQAGFQNDRRVALPGTVEVQTVPASVNQQTRRGIRSLVELAGDRLVGGAGHGQHEDQSQQPAQTPDQPVA
jgi:hypothetical protein